MAARFSGTSTFTFGAAGAPKVMDPFYATDGETFRVTRQMMEGLVGIISMRDLVRLSVRDMTEAGEPAAVRLALLAHHWRGEWEWDAEELKGAAERLAAWRRVAAAEPGPLPPRVAAALAADLDTPAALLAADELAERGDGDAVAAAAAVLGVALA